MKKYLYIPLCLMGILGATLTHTMYFWHPLLDQKWSDSMQDATLMISTQESDEHPTVTVSVENVTLPSDRHDEREAVTFKKSTTQSTATMTILLAGGTLRIEVSNPAYLKATLETSVEKYIDYDGHESRSIQNYTTSRSMVLLHAIADQEPTVSYNTNNKTLTIVFALDKSDRTAENIVYLPINIDEE